MGMSVLSRQFTEECIYTVGIIRGKGEFHPESLEES